MIARHALCPPGHFCPTGTAVPPTCPPVGLARNSAPRSSMFSCPADDGTIVVTIHAVDICKSSPCVGYKFQKIYYSMKTYILCILLTWKYDMTDKVANLYGFSVRITEFDLYHSLTAVGPKSYGYKIILRV